MHRISVLVGILILGAGGCREKESPPELVAEFNWEAWTAENVPKGSRSVRVFGPLLTASSGDPEAIPPVPPQTAAGVRLADTSIDGLRYFSLLVEHPEDSADGTPEVIFSISLRSDEDPPGVDIRLFTTVKACEIRILGFDGGTLRNVDAGVLEPPYVFSPGEYHLSATR